MIDDNKNIYKMKWGEKIIKYLKKNIKIKTYIFLNE